MDSIWLKRIASTTLLVPLMIPVGLIGQEKKTEQPSTKQSPTVKFSVRTNIVLVPLVVTDKRGEHVRGLAASDFELREDGKLQEIAGFEEVTPESSIIQRTVSAPNSRTVSPPNSFTNQVIAGQAKKLEIILLDLLNTPVAGRAAAQRGLIEYLSKSADADTLLALFVLRANGVQLIHDVTTDPAVLIEAIRKTKISATSRDSPTLNTNGGDADAEVRQLAAPPGLRAAEAGVDIALQGQESMITLECLQQISQYFAVVPGRKSLIWASTGFKFALAGARGERTLQMLQAANIAVYPVDVGGLSLGCLGDVARHGAIPCLASGADLIRPGGALDPYRLKHETMEILADTTGGRAYYSLNDSANLFHRVREDSAQYYMLSYYAKDTGKYGWRKLSIQVHSNGAQIRARSGFFFNAAVRDTDSTRQAEEMTALTSALESTSLLISGQWQQVESAGEDRKIHFALSLAPEPTLTDNENDDHIDFDFLILAWNAAGKQVARITQRVDRRLTPVEADQRRSHGIDYSNVLTLPSGLYDVRIVVRDNLRGSIGSVFTPLKVD